MTSLIPDLDVLVSLAPEELAEVVLRLADERRQNGLTHLQSLASDIHGQPGAAFFRIVVASTILQAAI